MDVKGGESRFMSQEKNKDNRTEIFVDPEKFDEHIREQAKKSYKHSAIDVRQVLKNIHKKKK